MEWLWILSAVLVLAGLVGLLLPVLPDTPLIFAGLLVGAWVNHFHRVGPWTLVLLGILALVGWGVDLVAGVLGARLVGAHRWAMVGAILGAMVGIFFGLPGLILGPMAGAALGELANRSSAKQVIKSGVGAGLGFLLALVLRAGISLLMIGIFVLAYFF